MQRGKPLRVMVLIPREEDGTKGERLAFARTLDLRNAIRAKRVHGVILVGPQEDVDPARWTWYLRKYSGRADLVIIEGHGGFFVGERSTLLNEDEFAIGTRTRNWRFIPDADGALRPRFGTVLVGVCFAGQHIARLRDFFAPGTSIITSPYVVPIGDVERVYKPVVEALTGGDIGDTVPTTEWGARTITVEKKNAQGVIEKVPLPVAQRWTVFR